MLLFFISAKLKLLLLNANKFIAMAENCFEITQPGKRMHQCVYLADYKKSLKSAQIL